MMMSMQLFSSSRRAPRSTSCSKPSASIFNRRIGRFDREIGIQRGDFDVDLLLIADQRDRVFKSPFGSPPRQG